MDYLNRLELQYKQADIAETELQQRAMSVLSHEWQSVQELSKKLPDFPWSIFGIFDELAMMELIDSNIEIVRVSGYPRGCQHYYKLGETK